MRPRLVLLVSLLACGALACAERPPGSQEAPASPATAPAGPAKAPATSPAVPARPPAPPAGEALPCTADADCPVLPCGPCEPGTPITPELLSGPSCARNPCKNAASVCKERVCVVHPDTVKDPAVWGTAPAK